MSGAKHLWTVVKNHDTKLLSAYATWDEKNSKRGKVIWAARYLKIPESQIILVEREEKVKYANPRSILIDDYDKNITEWEAKGGIGILYKSSDQVISKLAKYGIR